MKQRMIFLSLLVISSLFVLTLELRGELNVHENPVIGDGGHDEFVKYIDIVSGKENWGQRTAYVVVAASISGNGKGQGTLTNVTFLGETHAIYQDKPDYVGTVYTSGRYEPGPATSAGTAMEAEVPDRERSYSWSASGEVKFTPRVWKESITIGGQVRIPPSIAGTFSTTGEWDWGDSFTRSASYASVFKDASARKHEVKFQYKCDACQKYGDTAAAIGGKSEHEVMTCPRSGCSVRYRKCSAPSGHEVCDGCGDRKCDGDDHTYVGVCSGEYVHHTKWVADCGNKIYRCTRSNHQAQTYGCGHTMKKCLHASHSCGGSGTQPPNNPPPSNPSPSPSYHPCDVHLTSVSGDHSLQASCSSTNENGNCTVTNFYACDGHTHTYPEPPPPPTVSCGRRACTGTVSSTDEHRRGPCTACGKIYWSCGTYGDYHKNQCRERTCRYGGCGNQWRRCQSDTPYCRNNPDRRCWAR